MPKQRNTTHEFDLSSVPEVINVKPEKVLRKRSGQLTTEEKRRRDDPRYKKHPNYSDAKKMEVVCAYAVSGNSRRVAELTRVSEGTIRSWKTTEWWNELMTRIHQEQNEELDAKLTKLVDKAVDQINDRLDNGDYIYDAKIGELKRKPVNAKDMAIVTAITLDKRQLLRGEPTARVEKVSENEKLVRLAEEFKKFALAKEVESTALRIEEENLENKIMEITSNEEEIEEADDQSEEEMLTINEIFSDA